MKRQLLKMHVSSKAFNTLQDLIKEKNKAGHDMEVVV
jgi:hypothetical protein